MILQCNHETHEGIPLCKQQTPSLPPKGLSKGALILMSFAKFPLKF